MQTSTSASPFRISSHFSESSDVENGTNIVSHVTHLVDSYFIWVGGTVDKPNSSGPPPSQAGGGILADNETNAQESASDPRSVEALVAEVMQGGSFAKDFACAMPSRQASNPVLGVPVFRSRDSDDSLAISQRLARRFKKQMFLSLDVPTAVNASGQTSYFLLQVEKHLLATLKSFEQ